VSDNQITWFYAENGGHKGPVTQEQVTELLRNGALNEQTSVWSEGMTGWEPLAQTALNSLTVQQAETVEKPDISPQEPKQAEKTIVIAGNKTANEPANKGREPNIESNVSNASDAKQVYSVLAVGEDLTDWQYFKRCVTVKYKRFGGRARRKEFWAFILFYALLFTVALLLAMIVDVFLKDFVHFPKVWGMDLPFATAGISILGTLGFLIPYLAVYTRRMHDIELSGWYVLLSFIPLLGFIPFILALFPTRQTRANGGEYIYGPPPITQRMS